MLSDPFKRLMPFGPMNLIVHRHNAAQFITQKQRATYTVIQPFNPPQTIAENPQPVVIRIADGGQHTLLKVVEPRRLGQHQFIGQFTQIDRRFSQAIGNRRSISGRQHKLSTTVLMIGPHHRITGNRKPLRQRMTPAKPQPAIHFHCTGAIQPRPLKRQNPVQRVIGEGQQFLAGDHRHRAAVGNGSVGRSRRIAIQVLARSRHIIHRFLAHQRGLLRLAAHRRHRVGNQLVPSLQRRNRHGLDRRRGTAQQDRLGRLDMLTQARFTKLPGQLLQPPARTPRLDAAQHLGAHAYRNPHAARGQGQHQVNQHVGADLTQQLVHVCRRQQPHPTDHGRQVDKQQRLIAEHQQAFFKRIGAGIQQLFKLGLGQITQQLFSVIQRVCKPLKQLLEAVP